MIKSMLGGKIKGTGTVTEAKSSSKKKSKSKTAKKTSKQSFVKDVSQRDINSNLAEIAKMNSNLGCSIQYEDKLVKIILKGQIFSFMFDDADPTEFAKEKVQMIKSKRGW